MFSRLRLAILFVAIPLTAFAVNTGGGRPSMLDHHEHEISKAVVRAAQFVDVRHLSSRASCENVEAPEALTTPDPLFSAATLGRKVKVSFIIGTDGRVHSPLILISAGMAGDRLVLQTVRTWRYRPATCNGVPTETEGKVEFSSH